MKKKYEVSDMEDGCDVVGDEDASLGSAVKSTNWIVAVSVALFGLVFNGAAIGYTSPALPSMMKNSTMNGSSSDFVIDSSEASWVTSLSQLGLPFGALATGLLADTIGRRKTALYVHSLTHMVGFGLIVIANNVWFVYAGRFMTGVCMGMCNSLCFIYVTELCLTHKQRETTGVLASVMGYSSTVATYAAGVFLPWRELATMLMFLGVPYALGILFYVPETPRFLLNCGHQKATQRSLKQLYGEHISVFQYMKESEREQTQRPSSRKFTATRILIATLLVFFCQFSGYTIVSFYATAILRMDGGAGSDANSTGNLFSTESDNSGDDGEESFDVSLAAPIIIAVAGLLGVLASVAIVQRVKRKWIIMASAAGTAIALLALGAVDVLSAACAESSTSFWLRTLLLTAHVMLFSVGYGSHVFPVAVELIPAEARSLGMAVVATANGIFGFASAKSFPALVAAAPGGPGGAFLVYGAVNVVGLAFVGIWLPSSV